MEISPAAFVQKGAQLGKGVKIGPGTCIGEKVQIGDGTEVGAFSIIEGKVSIGSNCFIGHHVVIGTPPQDVSYQGEETEVIIGDDTILREFTTVHRATGEGQKTLVGPGCFIMAYAHVAHNCQIGKEVTMANGANLAGYVKIENWAVLSGMVGVHQFVRVGKLAMVGGLSKVVQDIPPYLMADGHPARLYGLNLVGMKRRGIEREARVEIRKIYRFLRSSRNQEQALSQLESHFSSDFSREILNFFAQTERGITRWVGTKDD